MQGVAVSDLLDHVVAAAGLTLFGAVPAPGRVGTAAPLALPGPGLADRITALRADLRAQGLDRVVLVTTGAAAPAAAAIARTLGLRLTVLDTADPHRAHAALAGNLPRTVVVLAAASEPAGPAAETDAHRRAFHQAFEAAGLPDPTRHFVVVATPDSTPEPSAHPFVLTPDESRSALPAPALIAAGLAGADVAELLAEASGLLAEPAPASPPAPLPTGFAPAPPPPGFTPAPPPGLAPASPPGLAPAPPPGFPPGPPPARSTPGSPTGFPSAAPSASFTPGTAPPVASAHKSEISGLSDETGQANGPGVALGAAIAAAVREGRDKLAVAADGTGIEGLGEWIEHVFAVAAPRVVPIILENPASWGHAGPDVLSVTVGGALGRGVMPGGGIAPDLSVNGPLGAQLLAWAQAARVAGTLLPPLPAPPAETPGEVPQTPTPTLVEGAIEVYGETTATTLIGAIDELAHGVPEGGCLAIAAHLDRDGDAAAAEVRDALAGRVARAVTFGWGPRARLAGAVSLLQITGAVTHDVRVPGRPYTFGELQASAAAAERPGRGDDRPALRLHLTDRATGIEQLLAALGG
ncbi:hypothetical protein [Dactylosporangium sp. CA-092794]|uniref:hypothetical protein n=1 Tax=Dactylosporangium sp. CA-092794 TaxID=3239929 RepID=UPI003D8BD4C0